MMTDRFFCWLILRYIWEMTWAQGKLKMAFDIFMIDIFCFPFLIAAKWSLKVYMWIIWSHKSCKITDAGYCWTTLFLLHKKAKKISIYFLNLQ